MWMPRKEWLLGLEKMLRRRDLQMLLFVISLMIALNLLKEIRRDSKYDAIIMDPPSYGRGPKGEIWKIEDNIHPFIQLCTKALSEDPLFPFKFVYHRITGGSIILYAFTRIRKRNTVERLQQMKLDFRSQVMVLYCLAGASGRWEK